MVEILGVGLSTVQDPARFSIQVVGACLGGRAVLGAVLVAVLGAVEGDNGRRVVVARAEPWGGATAAVTAVLAPGVDELGMALEPLGDCGDEDRVVIEVWSGFLD
jgi:hypothetical protein